MTELELLMDLHKDSERQGPGSEEETKKAINIIGINKNDSIKIADIGCGTGNSTMVLAKNTKGSITAVDFLPEFLEKLDNRSKEFNFQDRIKSIACSMDDLPFEKEEFDIIWSEGAIYNMGFEKGIKYWNQFLKKNGYLAVSEISWIKDKKPKELEDYWSEVYPQIDSVSNKIKILEENGYSPVGHFILPQYCWMDNYYKPLEDKFDKFLKKHKYSDLSKSIIDGENKERNIYKKYKDYYSYGFYIAKKIN